MHSQKLNGLDHLRTIAITLVFLFHYRLFSHPDWVNAVNSFGWTGVDLFFVLSGYLIADQLFKRFLSDGKISLKEFYLKRFFRIIPAYLVVLAVYFCVPFFREKEALPPLWKFLTFTQNFNLDPSRFGTFSHAWSLCIEEQFYLLFPVAVFFLSSLNAGRTVPFLIAGLVIMGFFLRIYAWNNYAVPAAGDNEFKLNWITWIYYPTYTRLDGLLMGIIIAAVFNFVPKLKAKITKYSNLILVAGLLFVIAAYFFCTDPRSYHASIGGFPLIAAAFATVVAAVISPSNIIYRCRSGISTTIAALSYSIYLVHKGTIHMAQLTFVELGIEEDSNLMFLLCILTTLAGAALLHYTIEKPFLKIRDSVLVGKQTAILSVTEK